MFINILHLLFCVQISCFLFTILFRRLFLLIKSSGPLSEYIFLLGSEWAFQDTSKVLNLRPDFSLFWKGHIWSKRGLCVYLPCYLRCNYHSGSWPKKKKKLPLRWTFSLYNISTGYPMRKRQIIVRDLIECRHLWRGTQSKIYCK